MIYGIVTYYYENGNINSKGKQYLKKKLGEWNYYDTSGKLTHTEVYQKGKLIKTIPAEKEK